GQALVQAVQVLFEAEKSSAVDGDDLVDAIAEQKAPIEYGHAGFVFGKKFSIQVHDGHGVVIPLARLINRSYSNHISTASFRRRKMPPSAIASRATSGCSTI